MIDFHIYDKYKEADSAGDTATLKALEQAYPAECGIYADVARHEKIMDCIRVLDSQRAREERYKRFIGKYGYEIRANKITPEMAKASFKGENRGFYNRYVKELGKA